MSPVCTSCGEPGAATCESCFYDETPRGELVVRVHAAALYVALLRGGFFYEAAEFADWYLEKFDHDLES